MSILKVAVGAVVGFAVVSYAYARRAKIGEALHHFEEQAANVFHPNEASHPAESKADNAKKS